MIKPKDRDMNRSKDVEGPKLLRSYDQEVTMKDKMMSSDLYHDDAPTGSIEKYSLSDLHQGDHEAPLTALGMEEVVVSAPMGEDKPDYKPVTAKGAVKDQQHGGSKGGAGGYSKTSKSEGSAKA